MYWSNDAIINSYNTAKDPYKQVKILSELNACSVQAIKKVLKEAGVYNKKTTKTYSTWSKEETKKLMDLYFTGMKISEVARLMNMSYGRVSSKIHSEGRKYR